MTLFVQGTGAISAAAAANVSAAFTNPVNTGNLLVALCGSLTSNIVAANVTDTLTNTWTLAIANDGGQPTAVVYAIANAAGACTVTLDCGTDLMALAIAEFAGIYTSSPVDAAVQSEDVNQPAVVSTVLSKAGVTVGCASSVSVTPQTVTPGAFQSDIYTHPSAGAGDISFSASYRIGGGPGSLGFLWQFSGATSDWWACGSGFLQFGATPSFPANQQMPPARPDNLRI